MCHQSKSFECILSTDYCNALSPNHGCDYFDIKKTFNEFCSQYHVEDEKDEKFLVKFHLVAEAYKILSNYKTKLICNNSGVVDLKQLPQPYRLAEEFVHHGNTCRNFSNIDKLCGELVNEHNETFLAGDNDKSRKNLCKGKNITKELYLTLKEVFFGGLKKIKIKKQVIVDSHTNRTAIKDKILKIPIKPGLPTGTVIIFPEEGDEVPFTFPGDIVFITQDRPHDVFQRDGANLLMTVKVTLQESLFGTVIIVNTIDDRIIRMQITSIITSDYKKIVPGEGLPLVENLHERGDLVIRFKIEFPLYLSVSSKNNLKRAFSSAFKQDVSSDNEHIHRFILNDKMSKYGEPLIPTPATV